MTKHFIDIHIRLCGQSIDIFIVVSLI